MLIILCLSGNTGAPWRPLSIPVKPRRITTQHSWEMNSQYRPLGQMTSKIRRADAKTTVYIYSLTLTHPTSFCETQKKPEECAPVPGIPVLTSPFVAEQPTGRRSLFTIDIGRHRKVSLLHTLSSVTKLLTHNGGSIHRDIWYQAHICPGGRHTRDKFPQVFLPESFAFHGCSYSSLSLGRQLTNCGKLLNFPSNFGWAVSSAY